MEDFLKAGRPIGLVLGFLLGHNVSAFSQGRATLDAGDPPWLFHISDRCMACHNGLLAPSGSDVSIGFDWRATMMANSARDPYWQAAVRREVMDHPEARSTIEDECSTCHMPMMRFLEKSRGREGEIFAHLPVGRSTRWEDRLAADGVSCAVCHQIQKDKFGTEESFTGGFVIDTGRAWGEREIFGPYDVEAGLERIMRSATDFRPRQSDHLTRSELCATCHTLYTHAIGPDGEVVGKLPEQVPYLEWLESDYRDTESCQDCHMPDLEGALPISSVLGDPREAFSPHVFRGGNFFMLRMLNRYRDDLGVEALPQELETAARGTIDHLQTSSATVEIESARIQDERLIVGVVVRSLAGHKLPTAYPSRRVWLRLAVRDGEGRLLFESGGLRSDGAITGNDNDEDPARYEPHYEEIRSAEEVQIYEAIMVDFEDRVTTGLISALRFVKDNRLLPEGFDKDTVSDDVAVQGRARGDRSFAAGGDRILYKVETGTSPGPFLVEAELWYQPIAYRWARNLASYDAFESRRFVSFYESMSEGSGVVLAADRRSVNIAARRGRAPTMPRSRDLSSWLPNRGAAASQELASESFVKHSKSVFFPGS